MLLMADDFLYTIQVAQLTSHEVLGSSSGQLASGVEDHFSAQAVSRLLLKKLLMMLKDLLLLFLQSQNDEE